MSTRDKSDSELFRASVGPVKRIEHDRALLARPRPRPYARQSWRDEQQVLHDMFAAEFGPEQMELDTEETLHYARTGVQHGIMRKLRRGHYAIEAELDLHGMTVAVAQQMLSEFLRRSQASGKRCVKVIHGKGYRSPQQQPVLKSRVNHWLRRAGNVVAFCSARQIDGGTGAVYVLIKQQR